MAAPSRFVEDEKNALVGRFFLSKGKFLAVEMHQNSAKINGSI